MHVNAIYTDLSRAVLYFTKLTVCVSVLHDLEQMKVHIILTRYLRRMLFTYFDFRNNTLFYSFDCRSNSLQNTSVPHSAFISPKIVNGKDVEEESCIETQDNHNSEEEARDCCETSIRQDSDSSVSDKQRQTIVIADSPSPAVSVITISSDTDEEETPQRHSLRE